MPPHHDILKRRLFLKNLDWLFWLSLVHCIILRRTDSPLRRGRDNAFVSLRDRNASASEFAATEVCGLTVLICV